MQLLLARRHRSEGRAAGDTNRPTSMRAPSAALRAVLARILAAPPGHVMALSLSYRRQPHPPVERSDSGALGRMSRVHAEAQTHARAISPYRGEMRGIHVDERDSFWESSEPRYRIFVFDGADAVVTTIDLVDASFKDAEWSASTIAGDDRLWSIALVVDDSGRGRGLIWLSGYDYNSPPTSPREWRCRAEMQDRLLAHRSRKGLPLTLPDGRRVIRLFPEWGREWPLWESFSDQYTVNAADLSLSDEVAAELDEWNAAWQARGESEPVPDGWIEQGWRLHARMQAELRAFAEVRPDFDR